ncbi:uncharacterized protein DDB_G0287625-like isoform X1 [Artemia franciscana]|uniref:uncharacterized protein DDB_G0287625-like isoform X1 n=1 Tax=Artemia franciscana TaxID=6661 RepID=UPI0032DB141D
MVIRMGTTVSKGDSKTEEEDPLKTPKRRQILVSAMDDARPNDSGSSILDLIPDFEEPKGPVIFVLGGPGSGKISLCNILANKIQRLVHIDVEGELKNESSFNKGRYFQGIPTFKLVQAISHLFGRETKKKTAYILTGFPRNMRDVSEYMKKLKRIDGVILLNWEKRSLERQINYGANEGLLNKESARRDLEYFMSHVTHVAEFFDQIGLLHFVSGDRQHEEIFGDLYEEVMGILKHSKDKSKVAVFPPTSDKYVSEDSDDEAQNSSSEEESRKGSAQSSQSEDRNSEGSRDKYRKESKQDDGEENNKYDEEENKNLSNEGYDKTSKEKRTRSNDFKNLRSNSDESDYGGKDGSMYSLNEDQKARSKGYAILLNKSYKQDLGQHNRNVGGSSKENDQETVRDGSSKSIGFEEETQYQNGNADRYGKMSNMENQEENVSKDSFNSSQSKKQSYNQRHGVDNGIKSNGRAGRNFRELQSSPRDVTGGLYPTDQSKLDISYSKSSVVDSELPPVNGGDFIYKIQEEVESTYGESNLRFGGNSDQSMTYVDPSSKNKEKNTNNSDGIFLRPTYEKEQNNFLSKNESAEHKQAAKGNLQYQPKNTFADHNDDNYPDYGGRNSIPETSSLNEVKAESKKNGKNILKGDKSVVSNLNENKLKNDDKENFTSKSSASSYGAKEDNEKYSGKAENDIFKCRNAAEPEESNNKAGEDHNEKNSSNKTERNNRNKKSNLISTKNERENFAKEKVNENGSDNTSDEGDTHKNQKRPKSRSKSSLSWKYHESSRDTADQANNENNSTNKNRSRKQQALNEKSEDSQDENDSKGFSSGRFANSNGMPTQKPSDKSNKTEKIHNGGDNNINNYSDTEESGEYRKNHLHGNRNENEKGAKQKNRYFWTGEDGNSKEFTDEGRMTHQHNLNISQYDGTNTMENHSSMQDNPRFKIINKNNQQNYQKPKSQEKSYPEKDASEEEDFPRGSFYSIKARKGKENDIAKADGGSSKQKMAELESQIIEPYVNKFGTPMGSTNNTKSNAQGSFTNANSQNAPTIANEYDHIYEEIEESSAGPSINPDSGLKTENGRRFSLSSEINSRNGIPVNDRSSKNSNIHLGKNQRAESAYRYRRKDTKDGYTLLAESRSRIKDPAEEKASDFSHSKSSLNRRTFEDKEPELYSGTNAREGSRKQHGVKQEDNRSKSKYDENYAETEPNSRASYSINKDSEKNTHLPNVIGYESKGMRSGRKSPNNNGFINKQKNGVSNKQNEDALGYSSNINNKRDLSNVNKRDSKQEEKYKRMH